MPDPVLSIIMPVYNAKRYVGKAIKSVLNQTFDNLELIVIDDGSSDNSLAQIQSISDDRIKLFRNDKNRGIVYSRNKGLSLAKGDFIGMFDADDIAYPEKFKEQVSFLQQNKDYGMIGSWANFIDKNGNRLPGSWKLKAPPEMIPSIMLFKNYFLQSAVLYRKECISRFLFRNGLDILEDYMIWLEILSEFKAWNLQKPLVHYRVHDGGVTKRKSKEMLTKEKKVFKMQLLELGIDPTDRELDLHLLTRNDNPVSDIKTLQSIEIWLLKILGRNEDLKVYNHKMLIRVIFNRWLKVCYKASKLHFKMIYRLLNSKLTFLFLKSYTSLK